MSELKIDISKPVQEFRAHLKEENNDRIIFSGQFGIGKTTFLKEFKEGNQDLYNVFHLYPVNYSVASNEDIFQLIKYDIFYELIGHELNIKDAFNEADTLPFFIKEKFYELIKGFMNHIPKIGKPALQAINQLTKLKEDFDKFHSKANKSELEEIAAFANAINLKIGSIYEYDFYSSLISSQLDHIKGLGTSMKENVLVIDDLDRVDPEHIFRLLNVFAAHIDFDKEETNKFGFDKIVLVMDINNVYRIFSNKYGQDVDFSGYLDKFFSHEVFYFDNQVVIDELIEIIVNSIKVRTGAIGDFTDPYNSVRQNSIFLMKSFLRVSKVNLRSLIKLYEMEYVEKEHNFILGDNQRILKSRQLNLPLTLSFLTFLCGSKNGIEDALIACEINADSICFEEEIDKNLLYKLGDLIPVLDSENFDFREWGKPGEPYFSEKFGLNFDYETITNHYRYRANIKSVYKSEDSDLQKTQVSRKEYFGLLLQAYRKLEGRKI